MIANPVTDRAMLDTNVVVYAYDADAGDRHERAVQLIASLQQDAHIVISAQVLNEFYRAITRPQRPAPLSHSDATQIVQEMAATWEVVPVTAAVTLRALGAIPLHSLAFWDALIWAAAAEYVVPVLYTEDFQSGRQIDGVRFINPFAAPP